MAWSCVSGMVRELKHIFWGRGSRITHKGTESSQNSEGDHRAKGPPKRPRTKLAGTSDVTGHYVLDP